MSDLAEFLRARLDEDEAAAKAATPGDWQWIDPGGYHKQALVADRRVMIVPSAMPDVYPSRHDAEHMTRHDPARVLAEVAAKRAVVDECGRLLPICIDPMTPAGIIALALAQPYAEHPDFDPEWRGMTPERAPEDEPWVPTDPVARAALAHLDRPPTRREAEELMVRLQRRGLIPPTPDSPDGAG